MLRIWHLLVLATVPTALGQAGRPESAFDSLPFEAWLKGGGGAAIQWTMSVSPARLSEYQRLETYIWVDVATDEFVNRGKPSQVVVFLEIRDRDNRVYRTHQVLTPTKGQGAADQVSVRFSRHAYIIAAIMRWSPGCTTQYRQSIV